MVSLCTIFEVDWPGSVVSLFSASEAATSPADHIVSLDCFLQSDDPGALPVFLRKSITMLCMPAVLLAGAVAVWGAVYIYRVKWGQARHPLCTGDIDPNGDGLVTSEELKKALGRAKVAVTDVEIS